MLMHAHRVYHDVIANGEVSRLDLSLHVFCTLHLRAVSLIILSSVLMAPFQRGVQFIDLKDFCGFLLFYCLRVRNYQQQSLSYNQSFGL